MRESISSAEDLRVDRGEAIAVLLSVVAATFSAWFIICIMTSSLTALLALPEFE